MQTPVDLLSLAVPDIHLVNIARVIMLPGARLIHLWGAGAALLGLGAGMLFLGARQLQRQAAK